MFPRSPTLPARPPARRSSVSEDPRGEKLSCGTVGERTRPLRDPDRFDVTRNAEHQAFGREAHFCLGTHSRAGAADPDRGDARTLPHIEIAEPHLCGVGVRNQLKTLPVRLR